MSDKTAAAEVKARHSAELLAVPHVIGVGTAKDADGGWHIEVLVDDESAAARLEPAIEGVPVHVTYSGAIVAGPARRPS